MAARILFSVLLLGAVLFAPFWLSVLLALGGIIYFNLYLEAVGLFLLSDLLYGTGNAGLLKTPFASFLLSFGVLLAVEFMKRQLRWQPKLKK